MSDTDLAITDAQELPLMKPDKALALAGTMTPAQARVDAVAALTSVALSKAATLQLTQEETDKLTAEFPDSDFLTGAAGKENLLYIQHSALRDRMNRSLGLGQWALVVRESWNEDFETRGSQGKPPQKGVRVYVRAMMLVRGCYVAEAVGDMDYFPGNAAQNYGDAFEGSKTAAFRRCAKEFGVGIQAWDKHWCEGWWQRKQGKPAVTVVKPTPQQNTVRNPAPPKPAPTAPLSNEERKAKLLATLTPMEQEANQVLVEEGLILPGESFRDISLTRIETMSPDNMQALIKTVRQRRDEANQLEGASVPDPGPTEAEEAQPDLPLAGVVESVSAKSGLGKNGKPFTKYGVKITPDDGEAFWANTFSQTFHDEAAKLKGKRCRYSVQQTNFGYDLTGIAL